MNLFEGRLRGVKDHAAQVAHIGGGSAMRAAMHLAAASPGKVITLPVTMHEPPLKLTPTILTSEGDYLHFLEPDPRAITMLTIAHALSHICRFTGHSRYHYSVAQHSVLVSYLVPPEYALQGLLHDAAEAFVGDVSSPLKQLIPGYKEIEKRIEAAVFERFGLPFRLNTAVKEADLVALKMEREHLMPNGDGSIHWQLLDGVESRPDLAGFLCEMNPYNARAMFIRRFRELTAG